MHAYCILLPSETDDSRFNSREKHMLTDSVQPYNKPIIDLACSVCTVKYQTSVFCMVTSLLCRSVHTKKTSVWYSISQYRPHTRLKLLTFENGCITSTGRHHGWCWAEKFWKFGVTRFLYLFLQGPTHKRQNKSLVHQKYADFVGFSCHWCDWTEIQLKFLHRPNFTVWSNQWPFLWYQTGGGGEGLRLHEVANDKQGEGIRFCLICFWCQNCSYCL
jgi:hypothetical protein